MSRDPFPGYATLSASQHPYSYVHNNPVNLLDPSGRTPYALRLALMLTVLAATPLALNTPLGEDVVDDLADAATDFVAYCLDVADALTRDDPTPTSLGGLESFSPIGDALDAGVKHFENILFAEAEGKPLTHDKKRKIEKIKDAAGFLDKHPDLRGNGTKS